jgi:aromatic ring-opening dioxygenase LigB subunit
MEHLKICCVSPHPPIMVTEVGGKEVSKVQGGVKALNLIADEIESVSPHTIIIMSPHSQILPDSFAIKTAPALGGSFAGFGAARVRYDTTPDLELARTIIGKASALGVPCEQVGGSGRDVRGAGELDHGILVPLYFLARKQYPLVCLSMSFLDLESHYRLGMATRDAVLETGRDAVFVASGDMSHRLLPGAPAGYSPRAKDFDSEIVDIISSGEFSRLFDLDEDLVEDAGECGLRSLVTMAGIADGFARESEVLSYEGPFGVGYLVARVRMGERDPSLSRVRGRE